MADIQKPTDLEGFVYDDRKDEILMARVVSYMAIILTLCSAVGVFYGLSQVTQSAIEGRLYRFPFPYISQIPEVKPGTVVALDRLGYAFTGAGTTVSRNVTMVTNIKDEELGNIIIEHFGYQVVFGATRGFLRAYEISYDDISIENEVFKLPEVGGELRRVNGMHKMNDKTILVVGSGEVLVVEVKVTVYGPTKVKVDVVFGESVKYSAQENYYAVHSDDLGDGKHLCITYETDDKLLTRVIQIKSGEGVATKLEMSKEVIYSDKYRFHNIAGLFADSNIQMGGYVLAAVGAKATDPDTEEGPVRLAGVFFNTTTLAVQVSQWTTNNQTSSYGFFDMDNLGRDLFVLCFNVYHSDAIRCQHAWFGMGGFQWGSTLTLQSGGAASYNKRMKLVIQNNSTFGLVYQNADAGGALTYVMGGFNEAMDLVQVSPSFIVSQRSKENQIKSSWCGVVMIDDFKVAIAEIIETTQYKRAYIHTAYVYPRPVGIALSNAISGKTEILFGGTYTVKTDQFVQGATYFCNDRGDLLRGPFFGQANTRFGVFYVNSYTDQSLLSLNNQVGYAVSKRELVLKLNRLL